MQRTPQPTRAAATATPTRPMAAASVHARTAAVGAVQIAPSQAKGGGVPTTTALTHARRALQPLDSNQRAAPASIAKAPFAYVSRFSRPAASAPTPSVAKPLAPTVTGLKRKQQPVEDAAVGKPTPTQSTEEADETDEASMAASDPLEQQRRENVAWLDMLVALLERKYQRHAVPVDIEAIQDAKLLDAYWLQKTPPTATASSKRSRVAVSVDTPPSATSSLSSTSGGGGGAAVLSSQDDKEEKRTQALRRHAQQIHDTSVSSTSCCGCKTGCLKMYCVCFSTRGYCHDGCSCENCKNARASADLRLEVMTTYLLNDPRAFSHAATTASAASGFFQLLPEKASTVVLRGCRCKKSKCLKKYCECFQNGLGCGPHCRCVDCANDTSAAAREMRARNASDMGTTAATSAASDGNHGATAAVTSAAPASGGAFHAIKVAVTKKPRRNYVLKSVRLRL